MKTGIAVLLMIGLASTNALAQQLPLLQAGTHGFLEISVPLQGRSEEQIPDLTINVESLFDCYNQYYAIKRVFDGVSLKGSVVDTYGSGTFGSQYANLVEEFRGHETLLFISKLRVVGISLEQFKRGWLSNANVFGSSGWKHFRFYLTLDGIQRQVGMEEYLSGEFARVLNVDSFKDSPDIYNDILTKQTLVNLPSFELDERERNRAHALLAQALGRELDGASKATKTGSLNEHYAWSMARYIRLQNDLKSDDKPLRKMAEWTMNQKNKLPNIVIDRKRYENAYQACLQTGVPELTKSAGKGLSEFNALPSGFSSYQRKKK